MSSPVAARQVQQSHFFGFSGLPLRPNWSAPWSCFAALRLSLKPRFRHRAFGRMFFWLARSSVENTLHKLNQGFFELIRLALTERKCDDWRLLQETILEPKIQQKTSRK